MRYEAVESGRYWHVETVDGEGRILVNAFFGPLAAARAREYAAWKNRSSAAKDAAGKTDYEAEIVAWVDLAEAARDRAKRGWRLHSWQVKTDEAVLKVLVLWEKEDR